MSERGREGVVGNKEGGDRGRKRDRERWRMEVRERGRRGGGMEEGRKTGKE